MKALTNGLAKLVVSYLTVFLMIMLLPVFLVTDHVSLVDQIMNYLFNHDFEKVT